MGQRLDRPAASATNAGVQSQSQTGTAVPTSLSTTFSSSSASSTSSSSSNTSVAVANPANGVSATSSQNASSRNSNSRHNHRHRSRHHRSNRASESDAQTTLANVESNADMSPRTRFRHEMARRGYTNNSSDLFVRLFQFPSQQGSQTSSTAASNPAATPTASDSTSITPTPSTTTAAASGSRGSSSGLSAFRFFNLGGGGNISAQNTGDLDSDLSSDEDELHWNHNLNSLAQSLPFFFGVRDFKCFVCNKQIPADDVEAHIMMCLTKPRLTYNEDVLTDDKGECIICFEELEKGQTIARLQCLCIYHKHCIDDWLNRSQSCPGHPPD